MIREFIPVLILSLTIAITIYISVTTSHIDLVSSNLLLRMREANHLTSMLQKEIEQIRTIKDTRETSIESTSHREPERLVKQVSVRIDEGLALSAGSAPSSTPLADRWIKNLFRKVNCLRNGKTSIFLYHVRKAAGTTVRLILEEAARTWNTHYYETEGVTLNRGVLDIPMLSIISLRDPIARIKSMYWYEHVGWWDGIVHDMSKCKSFREWTDGWRDGSRWKREFLSQNPGNVYVEIENYYVKSLIGWRGDGDAVGEAELATAKKILEAFDVVVLSEQLSTDSHRRLLSVALQVPPEVARDTAHQLKGDASARARLSAKLAADEAEVLETLKQINALDLRLYEFAKELVASRLLALERLPAADTSALLRNAQSVSRSDGDSLKDIGCGRSNGEIPALLRSQLGIHRPPGHKGPIDGFYDKKTRD